jgi:hypothetical protein
MTTVVGVHGIGNFGYFTRNGRAADRAAAVLGQEWAEALGRPEVHVAFYAHHLHRGAPQGDDDPLLLEPEAQEMLCTWIERLNPAVAQGPRTARVRQAVDWLTRRYGPAARVFAIAFCREVHTYLAKPDSPRRAAVRNEVAAVIAERRPSVVVAHSLGSVVAYETLWHHPGPPIDLLITVGSPLAMPGVVLERLRPTSNSRPPGVRRWVNVADAGDLVAVPRGGLGARFAEVQDEDDVTIGPWDFHTARGYLRTPEVRALIDTA